MDTLSDLSVLVTGGSRGLGLLLARQCVERRCDVTVAARDEEELKVYLKEALTAFSNK